MRIVGGKFRGRALATPKTNDIRPTTDRARESLFNILSHSYCDKLEQARMLELFAGTGAVGIEALSRGADYVLFVEESIEGRGLLRQNIDQFALQGCTRIFRRDATRLGEIGKMAPFDVVFADPPYAKGLGEKALQSASKGGWIADDALIILEEKSNVSPKLSERFEILDIRPYGDTNIHLYTYHIK